MGVFDFFKKDKNPDDLDNVKGVDAVSKQANPHDDFIKGDILIQASKQSINGGVYTIPSSVTKIAPNAFQGLEDLRVVVFHPEVDHIGYDAFKDCVNLEKLDGLEKCKNLKSIRGFTNCERLSQVELPDSIEIIGMDAFYGCKRLTTIFIPDKCWSIMQNAFRDCKSLCYIEIPRKVAIVHKNAFAGSSFLTVVFGDDAVLDEDSQLEIVQEEMDEMELDEDYDTDYEAECDEMADMLEAGDDFDEEEFDTEFEDDDNPTQFIDIDMGVAKLQIPYNKVAIDENAFKGVKEVVAHRTETVESIIKSGYRGNLTFFSDKDECGITMELGEIQKSFEKQNGENEKM